MTELNKIQEINCKAASKFFFVSNVSEYFLSENIDLFILSPFTRTSPRKNISKSIKKKI